MKLRPDAVAAQNRIAALERFRDATEVWVAAVTEVDEWIDVAAVTAEEARDAVDGWMQSAYEALGQAVWEDR
jgi:hypothetical protein